MNSNHKKILLFLVLFIGSGIIFKYYVDFKRPQKTRDHYNAQNENFRANPFYQSKAIESQNEIEVASADNQKSNFIADSDDDFLSLLNDLDKKMQKRANQCEMWLTNHLVDDDFIDVGSSLYQDKDAMLWLFHESFSKVLIRQSADTAFTAIENHINTKENFDPIDFYTKLESLDICRFPKIINFIDTIIEASVKLGWPEEDQKAIISSILDMSLIENNSSMEAMLFQLNMIQVLLDSKLIPEELSEEIQIMITTLQDHEVQFRQAFGSQYTVEENRLNLRDFLKTNREFWEDLKELLERTQFNLGL